MSDMTVGNISFGHLAESNWHKAEALRLDAENLELIRRINRLKDMLERCYAPDPQTAEERILLLKAEDDRL